MAKKRASAGSTKRAKSSRKKVKKTAARRVKKTAKRRVSRKVAKKKSARTVARKKVARKSATKKPAKKVAKRATRKPAAKAARPSAAARPKRPRRTMQALPPATRITPPPIAEAEPLTPPPAPARPPLDAEVITTRPVVAAPRMPAIGDLAPEFQLKDERGQLHALSQYRGQRVVLYFYPKDDTPGCTTEACGFRDRLGTFRDHNVVVLGISPDSVESHDRFAQKYGLTFPLLADDGHQVAEHYGVWVEKDRGGVKSMGIARTTFVIDAGGRIEHVFQNVHPDGHAQEVLAHLGA